MKSRSLAGLHENRPERHFAGLASPPGGAATQGDLFRDKQQRPVAQPRRSSHIIQARWQRLSRLSEWIDGFPPIQRILEQSGLLLFSRKVSKNHWRFSF